MIDIERLKDLVDEQAKDESLWFEPRYITEAILMRALRRIHAVIENDHEIDELISKLKELTKPKELTKKKFEIGQEVWLLNNFGKPITAKITGKVGGEIVLAFKGGLYRYGTVKELYSSKHELIEAQLSYWTSLKNEEESRQNEDRSMKSSCCAMHAGMDKECKE